MRHLVLFALLAVSTAACRDAVAPADAAGEAALSEASDRAHLDLREERASLIAAGNAVSDAIASQGLPAGLGGALAEDALLLMPRTNTIEGRAAGTAFLSGDPTAPSSFRWEVVVAEVSSDGTQGYTWAQGEFTIDLGGGPVTLPGFFLMYWRRGAGGDWEIAALVFNSGGPLASPIPAGFGTPENKHRRNFPNTEVADQRDAVRAADAAFSATSAAEGTGVAFERFAAPNAIAAGGGQLIYGPADIGEAFTGEPDDVVSWVPRFADVAASGDLGFTVGDATFDLVSVDFYSKYLTIWQKQDTGEWLYVADLGNSRPAPAP
ncbi:MAG TPA: nuclear transport factor 2 family protein [Gemmatimonadales bacterium]